MSYASVVLGFYIIIYFFQILCYFLSDDRKGNGDGLPYQVFLYVVIAVDQEVAHICNLPPLHLWMSITEFERKHVGSLTHNHDVVDDCMVRLLVGYEVFHIATVYILDDCIDSL